jgi:hypothetical protein
MSRELLLKQAAEARPDLLKKANEFLTLLEAISPEHALETRQEIRSHLDATSLELTKLSAGPAAAETFGAAAKNFGLVLAGTAAAGLAASLATDLYSAAKGGLTKGRNFKRMMTMLPDDVKELHSKKEIMQAFNSAHHFGPELTADPMVGSSIVTGILAAPVSTREQKIRDIITASKSFAEAGKARSPFSSAASAGSQLTWSKPEIETEEQELERMRRGARLEDTLKKERAEVELSHKSRDAATKMWAATMAKAQADAVSSNLRRQVLQGPQDRQTKLKFSSKLMPASR